MHIVDVVGRPDLALVFAVQLRSEPWSVVECVGALDPNVPRDQKMVIVVSSQFGCPVGCSMCDAGTSYHGNLSTSEIMAQILHVVTEWAGPDALACPKLKIQFARMGEPSLNDAVLDVIEQLPKRLDAPGLLPCVATVVPRSAGPWMDRLLEIRNRHYPGGRFQLQVSVQSTCERTRDEMMPVAKASLSELGSLASRFGGHGHRKVTLNFAMADGVPLEPRILGESFDPKTSLIKLTPLNPTTRAAQSGLRTVFAPGREEAVSELVHEIEVLGFECIVSCGLPEESEMGSSCGQLAIRRAENSTEDYHPVSASRGTVVAL